MLVSLLFIRELPFKNFYTRAFLGYMWLHFWIFKTIGRGTRAHGTPIVYWNNDFAMKALLNNPDLFWWNLCKVLPTNPPRGSTDQFWRCMNQPTFHQYHKNIYRYRWRKPRYVQWDGSMNMPTMPYLYDQGTDVPNGTLKVNANGNARVH